MGIDSDHGVAAILASGAAEALSGIIASTSMRARSIASDFFRNLLLFIISTLLNFRFSRGAIPRVEVIYKLRGVNLGLFVIIILYFVAILGKRGKDGTYRCAGWEVKFLHICRGGGAPREGEMGPKTARFWPGKARNRPKIDPK